MTALKASLLLAKLIYTTKWNSEKFLAIFAHTEKLCFAPSGRFMQVYGHIFHYLKSTGQVPGWVRRVQIFQDNAGSTNKNQYLMGSVLKLLNEESLTTSE